jgi:hypothetical protein
MRALCIRTTWKLDVHATDLTPIAMELLYSPTDGRAADKPLHGRFSPRCWTGRELLRIDRNRSPVSPEANEPIPADKKL